MNRIPSKIFVLVSILLVSHAIAIAQDKYNITAVKQTNNKNVIIEMSETDAPLDLKWLIQEAMEHNPEIIAAQKRLNAAKAKISQAKSLDDPNISIGSYRASNSPISAEGQADFFFTATWRIPKDTFSWETAL